MTKNERIRYFKNHVAPILELKCLITVNEFNENSFRLKTEDGEIIDYYPKSSRVFVHKTQKWFTLLDEKIIVSIEELLNLK